MHTRSAHGVQPDAHVQTTLRGIYTTLFVSREAEWERVHLFYGPCVRLYDVLTVIGKRSVTYIKHGELPHSDTAFPQQCIRA